jgi:hypothetical protein
VAAVVTMLPNTNPEARRARLRSDRLVRELLAVPVDPVLKACAGCDATIWAWGSGVREDLDYAPHVCPPAGLLKSPDLPPSSEEATDGTG